MVITEQQSSPGRLNYRWYLRSDGGGRLDPADVAVQHGEERGQTRVTFGPFDVHWSGSGDRGGGFMYYDRVSHMPIDPHGTVLCVTDLQSVVDLDGSEAGWHYKSSVAD